MSYVITDLRVPHSRKAAKRRIHVKRNIKTKQSRIASLIFKAEEYSKEQRNVCISQETGITFMML